MIFVLLFGCIGSTWADLVGYWPLDGDGTDLSDYGNDGTINGNVAPAVDRLGNPSGAMSFAGGGGDNINVGDPPEFQMTGAMTITAWVYLDSTSPVHGNRNGRILGKMDGGGQRAWSTGIEMNVNGVPWPATLQVSSNGSDVISSIDDASLPLDQWVHFAGVYDPGASMKVYLDGDLAFNLTTGIPASQYSANGHAVLIGNRPACGNCGWYGSLDDVRIYNEALSEGEIEAIMGMYIATNPNPQDGSRTPPSGEVVGGYYMLMTFTAGYGATTHTAYFSENFDDVDTRNSAALLGSPPYPGVYPTGYYVGLDDENVPEFARTPLQRGTTYYWVVDESNDTSTYPGDVWSFTVASELAWDATPVDDAQNVISDPNVDLAWQMGDIIPGGRLVFYDVYWGTDEATVAADTTRDARVDVPMHTIGPLLGDQDYYWKVNTVLQLGVPPFTETIIEGSVWHFKTLFSVPPVDPHLMAWWKLDGGFGDLVFDWSGSANHGTITGDAQFVSGQIDNAIDLDGSSQYVEVPNSAGLNLTKDFTIAAWIHPDVVSGSHGIVTKCEGPTHKQYILTFSDGELRFEYELSGNDYGMSGGTVTAGEWQHVAVTIDSLLLIDLYIDGVVVASETAPGEVLAQLNPVVIGRWSGTYNNRYFDGLIDDVRLYDIVKTVTGPVYATNPDPANRATDVPRTPTLTWKPGAYAASINGSVVYYSEDLSAVINRTAPSETLSTPSFTLPMTLDMGTTFYWRVDTANDVTLPGDVWPGDVWTFTTIDWISIDDMEPYVIWSNPAGPHIFVAWRDGFGDCSAGNGNDTGSVLTENPAPVLGGIQSMKYEFDNDGTVYSPCTMGLVTGRHMYSKIEAQTATLPSGIGSDWKVEGVKALSLRFYGTATNIVEPMWVQLADGTKGPGTKVTYGDYEDEDPNNITDEAWHEWFIDLADCGVDQTNIVSISIGIGNEDETGPHGNGTVYFDDFRLYTPRCFAARHSEEMARVDFAPLGAPDCFVNYKELDVMANDWLESDDQIPTSAPAAPVAHWKFDGDLIDEMAAIAGAPYGDTGGPTYVGGYDGDALSFSAATGDHVIIPDVDGRTEFNTESFSIALWIKSESQTGKEFIVCNGTNGSEFTGSSGRRYVLKFENNTEIRFLVDDDNRGTPAGDKDVVVGARADYATGDWVHVAMVRDTGAGELRLYRNGILDATNDEHDAYEIASPGEPLFLGGKYEENAGAATQAQAPIAHFFTGQVDDLRIYNYVLSDSEIANVTAMGLPYLYVPISSPAEIYEGETQGERAVNFKDYAELMDSWLLEIKYPR